MHRTEPAGRTLVGIGSGALALSLVFSWVPGVSGVEAFLGLDVLLFALAGAGLVLTAFAAHRSTLIPLVYARVVGLCALVCVVYGVVELETGNHAGRVQLGVLLAALGATLIVGGSSAAISDMREAERADT